SASQKLGQPVPLSNLVVASNNASPQAAQWNTPSLDSARSGLLPGRSVPDSNITEYSYSDRRSFSSCLSGALLPFSMLRCYSRLFRPTVMHSPDGGGDLAAVPRPVNVEVFATFPVNTLKGMCAEVVALCLQHVRGHRGAAVAVKEVQG